MSEARLIVNADDLGLTEGHNQAIVAAHLEGILTSASLMAGGAAFEDAVERVRSLPRLGIGVHLTLLESRPVLPPEAVPGLVDQDGVFGLDYVRLFVKLSRRQIDLQQVGREWRAQVEKVMASGLSVTHIDSHKHIHMHPCLLPLALRLVQEYGLKGMRLSCPLNIARGLKPAVLGLLALWARQRAARENVRTPDVLLGLEASGQMTEARLLALLARPWTGTRELMVHPAYPTPLLDHLLASGYRWIATYRFEEELAALCSPSVQALLQQNSISLIHYGALV